MNTTITTYTNHDLPPNKQQLTVETTYGTFNTDRLFVVWTRSSVHDERRIHSQKAAFLENFLSSQRTKRYLAALGFVVFEF